MSDSTPNHTPVILVVDDDPSQRALIGSSLRALGMRIVESGNGLEAIGLFQACQPHLVLMSTQMPICDGFEACIEMRRLPGGVDAAIVIVTDLEDFESIERAYEVGATDFLTKPIDWQIFVQRVKYLLRSQEAFIALHQSRKRLAWAQRVANLGNWELDLSTKTMHCSSEVMRIVGVGEKQKSLP